MGFLKEYQKVMESFGLPYEGYGEALLAMYQTSPPRPYHNKYHIERMLDRIDVLVLADIGIIGMDEYSSTINCAKLATLYHDCVYIPGFARNESLSGQILVNHIQDMSKRDNKTDSLSLWTAEVAILHTKAHKPPLTDVVSALVCDADLYELGTESYHLNSLNIWREFGKPDEGSWTEGRRKFLIEYLGRPKIFTLAGQESLEAKARSQMKNELNQLGGCPNDTNGDGDCGQKFCPFCGH